MTPGGLSEPALTDFLDSFLEQPLDFRPQISSARSDIKKHSTDGLHAARGGFQQKVGGINGTSKPPQEFLQAQSFTDVLANVANDLHQPLEVNNAWGGSFMSAGDWNFEQTQHPTSWDPLPTRLTSTTDCSSNNSGDVVPVKQEELTSLAAEGIGSEGDSDLDLAPSNKGGTASKSKETAAGRAEQRRTRKREKDRIEELQAAIQKAEQDKEQLAVQTADLGKQLQDKDEELRKLRAAEESALPAADDDRLAASFEGVLKLTVREGCEIALTQEQIRTMSREELVSLWSKYVHRLRELLQALPHPPGDQQQILQKVYALQREAMILYIRSAIANLGAVKSINACGALDRQPGMRAPFEFWQKVTHSLQLSPSQKGLMTELWQSFHCRIGNLMQVRGSICNHMLATIPDGVFGRSFAINFLKAHELMDALKYNLRQEHIVLCDLAANFHKILMPLQNASCMINSWPYWPNMPQIAKITAQAMQGC